MLAIQLKEMLKNVDDNTEVFIKGQCEYCNDNYIYVIETAEYIQRYSSIDSIDKDKKILYLM